jgi:predicted ATP-dependent serine protease
VDELAVDLGIVASMASSFLDKPIDKGTVVFGEVGLAGEVRGIPRWTSGSRRQPVRDSGAASFLRHLPEMVLRKKRWSVSGSTI